MNRLRWYTFVGLAILIGLYPVMYAFLPRNVGLLSSKSPALLADLAWNLAFYAHISFGGLALLSGWSQFSASLRARRAGLHRSLGKLYIFSVLISGTTGLFIALYATGGWVSGLGFFLLGIIWLMSTVLAWRAILQRRISAHQNWMIYSYAACFAAVTLRLWLPLLSGLFGAFLPAYQLVAWLCWTPNMAVAWYFVRHVKTWSSIA